MKLMIFPRTINFFISFSSIDISFVTDCMVFSGR
jgi:hypothetical protein